MKSGLTEFFNCLCFDLPDTLAGHTENSAYLFQGVATTIRESKP